jgi:signal transduction histidine kinase
MMTTDHLKFSPEILRRLGEELTPHPDQGVLELVRNAYDADALSCQISIRETDRPGGTVVISDDGVGMDADEIANGWLLIGKSGKEAVRRTKLGRLTVGNKGLGRLAALRMGSEIVLRTRSRTDSAVEHSVTIDWTRYDSAQTVEQVDLSIEEAARSLPKSGTTIEIRNLVKVFSKESIHRLARALLLLADPFGAQTGFQPILDSKEFESLNKLIKEKYFEDAEFHLTGHVDSKGKVSASVLLSNGRVKWTADHTDVTSKDDRYKCPEATFELWLFLLKASSFTTKSASLAEVRDWIKEWGGVHLYHRGLRVQPYGDPGHDWLDMNLARTRNPEDRPSTNNSIGRVVVEDIQEVLVQKTDRTGFVESEQFAELRRFAFDLLEWLADVRLKESEKRRRVQRQQAHKTFREAKSGLTKALKSLPKSSRASIEGAVKVYETAREREVRNLHAEVQLYRTLSTVGTTYAVFAHELAGPGRRIRKLAESVAQRARKHLGLEQYALSLQDPVASIVQTADEISLFPRLALRLLERDKRKQGRLKLHNSISEVLRLTRYFVDLYKAQISLQLADGDPEIFGSPAAVESILMNLLTNSLNAFASEEGAKHRREISIRTEIQRKHRVCLRFLDSGPGIQKLNVEDIWLPGRTTSPDGTGLGLTIVRDSVADLGGTVAAVPQGELGGAEFILQFPLAADAKENN